MKITIFPGKYHQNGGFSMSMLVYRNLTMMVSKAGEDLPVPTPLKVSAVKLEGVRPQ